MEFLKIGMEGWGERGEGRGKGWKEKWDEVRKSRGVMDGGKNRQKRMTEGWRETLMNVGCNYFGR